MSDATRITQQNASQIVKQINNLKLQKIHIKTSHLVSGIRKTYIDKDFTGFHAACTQDVSDPESQTMALHGSGIACVWLHLSKDSAVNPVITISPGRIFITRETPFAGGEITITY
jgi:hypothetical protein